MCNSIHSANSLLAANQICLAINSFSADLLLVILMLEILFSHVLFILIYPQIYLFCGTWILSASYAFHDVWALWERVSIGAVGVLVIWWGGDGGKPFIGGAGMGRAPPDQTRQVAMPTLFYKRSSSKDFPKISTTSLVKKQI